MLALILPFLAAVLQHLLWPTIQPFAWILFYPAVFLSSWIGGLRVGVVSTIISAFLVWWSFVPPEHTFAKEDPRYVLSAIMFIFMGTLFSLFNGRLRKATQHARDALAAANLASDRLQNAHDQIRQLVEQASDGIFIADVDGRCTGVNETGCLMLGFSRDEIVGKLMTDLLLPEDADRLRQANEQLQMGETLIAEWSFRRKDGTYLPVEASAKILPDGRRQALVRDITERKRAEGEIRMFARFQAAIGALGVHAVRTVSLAKLFDEAVALVAQTLDIEYSKVMEFEPERQVLLLRAGVGWNAGLLGSATVEAAASSQAGFTLHSDWPVIIENLQTERRFTVPRLLLDHGVVSGISVPIRTTKGAWGVLGAHSQRRRTFNKDEVDFLQSVANILGQVIERFRIEEALRESEANLKRAQEVGNIGSWYMDVVHHRLAWSDEVFRIFGLPLSTPLTYETFRSAIHPDDREKVDKAWEKALLGSPYDIEHRILVDHELRWVRERAQVELDAHGAAIKGIGTVQDITERKLVQERLLQINRANRALSKCNQALVRAIEEGSLLQQICDIVVQDAEYPLCWVGRVEHDESKSVSVIAQAGWTTDYLTALSITWADSERGRGPVGTCIRTREKVTARDIATDPGMVPWRARALKRGYASVLAIPLLVDSEVYGALTIYSAEADAFGVEEIQLLSELADDLAFGINALRVRADRAKADEDLRTLNVQLEQRVLARTRELQQAREFEFEIGNRIQQTLLLDQPPSHISGLCIAALSLPTQRIDGDFYVFIEPREGSLDVIVGDVMGKGIPAALLGAATKTHLLKAHGQLTALSTAGRLPKPKEIVMLAHAEIARQLIDLESFVTLCYARVDLRRRLMELVDCGHTGVIQLHSGTGKASLLHGDNLPLGVREGEIYEQVSAPLAAGDLLIFFSDGISEARNTAGEEFSTDRLQELIQTQGRLDPPMLVNAIRQAVVTFCGSDRLKDDLTIVAMRVEEVEPAIARAELAIKSDLRQLRHIREFVRSFCRSLSPPGVLEQDAIDALELAVDEAASNIMKHAYLGRVDQQIDIEAEAFSGRIAIRLYHRGLLFEPVPPALPTLDGSRESGFGLYILARTVDEVNYFRDERGRNCVALVKLSKSRSKNERKSHGDTGGNATRRSDCGDPG